MTEDMLRHHKGYLVIYQSILKFVLFLFRIENNHKTGDALIACYLQNCSHALLNNPPVLKK